MSEIHNPYWAVVGKYAKPTGFSWRGEPDGALEIDWFIENGVELTTLRRDSTLRWAWSVPDPDSLAFVAEHARGKIIDPMAGTGYWPYLLQQLGIEVKASDLYPPLGGTQENNHYHRGAEQFVKVHTCDAAEAMNNLMDPAFTLFLSWPPMSDGAAKALEAYPGDRLIYIGEGWGGCTADDSFFELLAVGWTELASHRPVQYSGIHDFITVFDRNDLASDSYEDRQAA